MPQSSVSGSLLRNIGYNSFPGQDSTSGVRLSMGALADDLITAKDRAHLQWKLRDTVDVILGWLGEHDLFVSPETTELIILRGRVKYGNIECEQKETPCVP